MATSEKMTARKSLTITGSNSQNRANGSMEMFLSQRAHRRGELEEKGGGQAVLH
jgi:hypothetical protein